jgi:O-antigen ligase
MSTQTQFAHLPPHLRDDGFVPNLRSSPFTLTLVIRLLVTVAFFITLMQYWVDLENGGLVPIVILFVAGFLTLFGTDRQEKLTRIFSGGAVLLLFALLSEVVSYFTGALYSIQYGLILIGLFLAARLIIMHIGLLQIVRCYAQSAILCTLIILIAGRKQLSGYQGGETRFTGGAGAHPNLLGFTLASYFPLFVGMALDLPRGKRRLFMGGLALVTIVLLFTTGSRGSLGAVVAALVITALRFTIFNRMIAQMRLSTLHVVYALLGAGVIVYVVIHGTELARIGKFVVSALQLDSQQRGIHSGLSGRTSIWAAAIHRLSGLEWVFGMGYRQGIVIDSGYVTVLFDNGLVGGSVILGSMLRVFYWLWKSTNRIHSPGWWRYYMVLWSMMIIYFINNVTTRYLFSYGNQFSLLVIFMIVCRKEELLGTVVSIRRPSTGRIAHPEGLPAVVRS